MNINNLKTNKSIKNYQAPAVQKAFQLLKTVADSNEDLGLSDLARMLNISKSTAHGIVQALLKIEALAISPKNKKFHLGPTIVDLAFKNWNYLHLTEKAQPYIDSLKDSIEETVFLTVIERSHSIIRAVSEASKPLKISSPAGTTLPILSGAIGKVFLAELDNAKAAKFIRTHGLPRFTQKTIVKEEDYIMELNKVRRDGYALDDEEYMTGVRAVAVALGNQKGLPLVICAVGFLSSISDKKIPHIINQILKTSNDLKGILDSSM